MDPTEQPIFARPAGCLRDAAREPSEAWWLSRCRKSWPEAQREEVWKKRTVCTAVLVGSSELRGLRSRGEEPDRAWELSERLGWHTVCPSPTKLFFAESQATAHPSHTVILLRRGWNATLIQSCWFLTEQNATKAGLPARQLSLVTKALFCVGLFYDGRPEKETHSVFAWAHGC